ncbi:hypothetical protein [Lysobacter sp. M15]|uniref:hypothetical protein n=1 Tax=Lysobacter sp. M15 TaxID=2916837 RepID=UPI001F5703CA|nr:hypothetical protein [Lysobacter sp. M15]
MHRRPQLLIALALSACLLACAPQKEPFARLAGLVLDERLREISGMAASRVHEDVLWLVNDGGNDAALYAVSRRGGEQARFVIDGVANTDWEDLAAFELDGRHYLLIADTGDNGGLRRTLQLHVVEEPATLEDGSLKPVWSIAFRWPDGARDCEAVAVDAAAGQVLLVSKKRRPPELFALPLRPATRPQTARRLGTLAGIPQAGQHERRGNRVHARLHGQVTSADLSPDARTLAVMTYGDLVLYRRHGTSESWTKATRRRPELRALPWIPQAEAVAWSAGGRGLFATGEFSPAPLFYLVP